MKKLTTALCAVLLMILVLMPGAAAAGPALSATRAYCIIDADTGLVLAQQNMNEELHPASITKVMTLALACEKAQGSWDGVKLTVSHEDVYSLAGTDSSHIALQEGPSALRHGDDLFIVYSTRGSWSRHYKLGQLRLRTPDSDPLNPASWIKSGPIFTGNDRIHGVGHASFTTSPDGNEYWIYYHSKKDTVHNWGRDVRLQRFDFDATGNPRFGEPAEPGPYPMPSGTPKHAN